MTLNLEELRTAADESDEIWITGDTCRALLDEIQRLRDALEEIADGAPPHKGDYEIQGVYDEDARYVYPARMKWIRDHARAALGGI